MVSEHSVFFTRLVVVAQIFLTSSNGAPLAQDQGLQKHGALRPHQHQELFQGPEVFLTVSPIAGYQHVARENGSHLVLTDRKLVLNWHGLSTQESESFVGLFDKDPFTLPSESLKSSALHRIDLSPDHNSHSGRSVTSTRYLRQNWTSSSPRCTGFWAAHATNNGRLIQSNCFKIYPTWMNDIKETIGNVPLHSLMIPGTHNSGAVNIYNGTSSDNVLMNYLVCQEDSIYQQLIHGIRYLDVRVGYYPDTKEEFWINHDQFSVQPFVGVLDDVKKFLQETNEILFLDFHRFPVGFNDTVHETFVTLILDNLGVYLAPEYLTSNATPEDLWKLKKNVILGYADSARSLKHDLLWPNVMQAWGNSNKIAELESFLSRSHLENGCSRKFWASMAHLTFNLGDVLTRPDFGIQGFANFSNPEVTVWYRSRQWYGNTNIVATDYYKSTNLIEMSFMANKNKASLCVK